MTRDRYRPRLIDGELDELQRLPAIALEGPRAVGKTSTAERRAHTVYRLDDPASLAVIRADPRRLQSGTPPVLIDEWQRFPESWDLVRRAVDDDRSPGRFLLTGSASPRIPPTHSGAGRIATVRMRPMALAERDLEVPSVSLGRLLDGTAGPIEGDTAVDAERYAYEITQSGLPALQGASARIVAAELDGYLERLIDRDLADAGHSIRSRATLRRWMDALAAATSTTTSFEKIRQAVSASAATEVSRATTARYVAALEAMWLIEPVPGWLPTTNELRRLTTRPKHQLADPAFAARIRRLPMEALLAGAPGGALAGSGSSAFGSLFESIVTLSVRAYAQGQDARVFHLRTMGGEHEVDLIVEGPLRRVLAIEVKLTADVRDDDVKHLLWLREKLGQDLIDAIVVSTGRHAYRRADGIGVVPAALLGP